MKYFEFLKNYDGLVNINNKNYSSSELENFDENIDELTIELTPRSLLQKVRYRISVKGWMCNNSGNLDFHRRWNNGIPMPSNTINCEIQRETPGMYFVTGTCDNGEVWTGYISKAAIIEKVEL